MLRCASRKAFALILVAVFIISMIPALAELNLSNSSHDISVIPPLTNESFQISHSGLISMIAYHSQTDKSKTGRFNQSGPISYTKGLTDNNSSQNIWNMANISAGATVQDSNDLEWQKCLGGSSYDKANSIQQTADGGYILAGVTSSNDGDISGSNGLADAWVVKLDSNKAIQWQKCLPGLSNCNAFANSVRQTSDGGYIVAGYIEYNYWSYVREAWVVKLSSSGNLQWQKYLQNPATMANSVQQTTDGGYIVAGGTGEQYVTGDLWVAKLASNGATEWQKSLGGSNSDIANSVQQTTDGGYILAGGTTSNDGNVSGNHGNEDSWVLKLSSTGAIQWQKCLGGSQDDEAKSIQQTTDGGYILAGGTTSNDGDVSFNQGAEDFWVVKLGSDGAVQWQKCLGGSGYDVANSVQQTTDGGYVVAGYASSMDGDASYNHGSNDFLVVKLDPRGVPIWNKCLGGGDVDEAYSIQQTSDEGYIVAGDTNSNNGDVAGNHGGYDFWVAKIEPQITPTIPLQPLGQASGLPEVSYSYSTSATDPNGYKLKYIFDWVDGTSPSQTGFVNPGTIASVSHSWSNTGIYKVKTRAINSKGASSEWSDTLTVTISTSNPPLNTCLGGSSYDKANSIQQTADGGYILAGVTSSNDGDISGSNGLADAWVVKLDSNKAIQWQKCLPGLSNCNAFANNVRQTSDGGYIVAGYIQTTYYSYICEAWVVKLSSSGNLQWQKYLQNPATIANSVQQTTDGGYIVAGGTGEQYVTGDLWVAKLASNGATEWQKSLGGSNSDIANSVQQTTDGGYILAGSTTSNDGSVSGNHGNEDSWVVKLGSTGALQWQKCLGGSQSDEAKSIQQTTDGGYILAGGTTSNDGDVSLSQGTEDFWVVKLGSDGAIQWQKCLGGSGYDVANSVQQTIDGGYVVAGSAGSTDGDASYNHGSDDFLVIKLNSQGVPEWNKCLGGSGNDEAYSVQQTSDEGYIVAGDTNSNNGDVAGNHGGYDFWVGKIKTENPIVNPPILLAHGIMPCRGSEPLDYWRNMAKFLTGTTQWHYSKEGGMERFVGKGNVVYISHYAQDYSVPTYSDIGKYAENLGNEVEAIKKQETTGAVDIIAHSMGGLVSWYNVDKLIMIGTPNHGSIIGNAYIMTKESELKGNKALTNLITLFHCASPNNEPRISLLEMAYHSTFLNSLGYNGRSNYYLIAGNEPHNPILQETGKLMKQPNDGVVTVSSVSLNGAPSPTQYQVDHFEENSLKRYDLLYLGIYNKIESILEGNTPIQAGNDKYISTDVSNETLIPSLEGIIDVAYPHGEKIYPINVSFSRQIDVSLIGQEGNLSLDLVTPSGKKINKSMAENSGNVTYYEDNDPTFREYIIKSPEPGMWKANVKAIDVSTGGENYTILTLHYTDLNLSIQPTKYLRNPNEPIEIKATLCNNSSPVTSANVVAHFLKPDGLTENVSLYDDGSHNDSSANDGLYANTFSNTSLSGAYQIVVVADGTLNNNEFMRQNSTTVWAQRYPDLTLSPADISVSDSSPFPNQNVTLNATIHNIGNGDANNASILFYDGSPVSSNLIARTAINVSAGSITKAEAFWNAVPGTHTINIWVSPYNRFLESNYSNNNASKTISVDSPPITQDNPSGPTSGTSGTTCGYSTVITDSDGDQVRCTFDWGDGTFSATGLINSGTNISESHTWSKAGTYQAKVNATDSRGVSSGWSNSLIITIDSPPNTPSIPSGPGSGQPGTSYSYSMSVNDPDGDRVQYTFNWGDGTPTSTTGLVSSGQNAGESHIWTKGGTYQVKSMATDSHGATSGWSSPLIVAINTPPNTPSVPIGLVSGTPGTANTYSTNATDPDGNQVSYTFDWGDANSSASGLVNSGTRVSETHGWSAAGIYQVKAMATDSTGASSGWSGYLAVTINTRNTPPDTPSIPFGPSSGYVRSSYRYSTSANDPDGDRVKYTFDWGDGTNSSTELFDSGISASASHTWSKTGTYLVVAQTKDSKGTSSGWSSAIAVTVAANSLPNAPSKPTGSATGVTGSSYSYSTSATDPDGDQVKYTFDWGDGLTSTTALVNSGTSANASHAWSKAGTYLVKTNATDFKGDASGYSSALTVTINPNKPPNAPSKPTGSVTGVAGSSYSYSTSATDPDNYQVKYTFDWGDNTPQTTTDLVASGATASMPHSWSAAGTYQVKAMATDSKGATSGWSNTLAVSITGVNTNQVALQAAANNKYVSADNGGNLPLIANRGAIGSWETFDLIDLGNNNVALRAHANNKYVSADNGGNLPLIANRGAIGSWETFDLIDLGNNNVALRAHANNKYVSADNGGNLPLIANRNTYAQWETFKLITGSSNRPPTTPSIPSYGPTTGMVGTSYSYSTMATDPNNYQVKYTFDWGDGLTSTTALVNSGTGASASHAWSKAGTYLVKTNATDFKGDASGYSSTLTVKIGLTVSSGSDKVGPISSLPGKKDLYEPLPGLNGAQERQGEKDKAHADAVQKTKMQQSGANKAHTGAVHKAQERQSEAR
jgi:hypothetical protein